MISHWEVFEAGPTPPVRERMHVTLNYKNVILLNGNVHEQMGSPEAVQLLFDKVNSVIGLNPVSANTPSAFRLKQKGGGTHRLIVASPFCRHYGIKIRQHGSLP